MIKSKLIYPDLSYDLVGLAFRVYNKLGYGYQEKYYQRAYAEELKENKHNYSREVSFKINYGKKIIGRYYLDFLIDDKVVIELKVAEKVYQRHINQVLGYLKECNLRLGIIILFKKDGLEFRRVIN